MSSSTLADHRRRTLVPFHRMEGFSLKEAAEIAGKSETTIRTWCHRNGIGRRVAGGAWVVSRVALRMLLEGDGAALQAYLNGDRTTELVARYFRRLGLEAVLEEIGTQ